MRHSIFLFWQYFINKKYTLSINYEITSNITKEACKFLLSLKIKVFPLVKIDICNRLIRDLWFLFIFLLKIFVRSCLPWNYLKYSHMQSKRFLSVLNPCSNDFQYARKWNAVKFNNCNSKILQSLSFFEIKI